MSSVAILIEVMYPERLLPDRSASELRAKIVDILNECEFGRLIGAGYGLSMMTFTYLVEDEPTASELLDDCMLRAAPQYRYTMKVLEK